MEFLPKEQCQKDLFLLFILLDDINYIIVLPYEFHVVQLSYNAYVSLVVCLLCNEGKQKFLQTVLVQGAEEETNTFKKDLSLF